jgi:AraC family transcriptional regulator of adaptative response / DNA-3-methyladenine glycosylase II
MSLDLAPGMDLDAEAAYRALQTRDARFDGRLFVGVISTGVYCRPICPARTPRREHVRFFTTAAGAQAQGFRACLRCRPETSPDLGAWCGASNTVARALSLIEAGALDEADVAALADRLGVGERQLRRLFQVHLGASPLDVAQTRRVLLAKQLIHETSLPMAEVALAAGFGSVRRFNETFQRLYSRPPLALRRHARREPETHAVGLKLSYRPPYDWDAVLSFLACRAIPGVEVVEGDRYARVIALGGVAGTLGVRPATRNRIEIDVRFPNLAALPQILARARRVFDLAADPVRIGEHLSRDPALAPLVTARPGLRSPGAWDGFELAVRAILGQQITVAAARRLAGKLVQAYGAPLPEPWRREGLEMAFPAPQRLVGAEIATLGTPGARGRALSALAAAVVADPALFGPRADLQIAVARLRSLPGVGEWTAQYIAMRALREPDAFPAADVGLMRALVPLGAERPSPDQLLARAEAWRPWRAYAAQHLWTADSDRADQETMKETARGRTAA